MGVRRVLGWPLRGGWLQAGRGSTSSSPLVSPSGPLGSPKAFLARTLEGGGGG